MSALRWLAPVWMAALVFVYPIPHTIALRNVLLLAGLIGFGIAAWRQRAAPGVQRLPRAAASLRWALVLLALLTVWMLLQSALISPRPVEALRLWKGDWLVALIVLAVGVLAQRHAPGSPWLLRAAMLALGAHTVWTFAFQLIHSLRDGVWPHWPLTPVGNKDHYSIIATTLAALLLGSLAAPTGRTRRTIALVFVVLAMLTSALVQARNGVLITAALAFAAGVIALHGASDPRRRRTGFAALAVLLVLGAAVAGSDPRWRGFVDAVRAGMQPEQSAAWLHPDRVALPTDARGQPVEGSAYLRAAWATVALEQIPRHPLGLGYGHKAFGWAVAAAYDPQTGHESSHSGLLDFTLANGFPGIVLWLALMATLIRHGLKQWLRTGDPAAATLALLTGGYLLRCLVDGHLSGWPLELFALLVGLAAAARPDTGRP